MVGIASQTILDFNTNQLRTKNSIFACSVTCQALHFAYSTIILVHFNIQCLRYLPFFVTPLFSLLCVCVHSYLHAYMSRLVLHMCVCVLEGGKSGGE